MLSPIPQDRYKMIEAALKEKAPKTYQALKRSRKLRQFIANHDAEMMESYNPMEVSLQAMDQVPDGEYLQQVQAGNAAIKELDDQTLATWLDFSDPMAEEG